MERSNRQRFSIQALGRYLGFGADNKQEEGPGKHLLTPSHYRHTGLSLSLTEKEAEIVGCLEIAISSVWEACPRDCPRSWLAQRQ